jgi:hypothetical protein
MGDEFVRRLHVHFGKYWSRAPKQARG